MKSAPRGFRAIPRLSPSTALVAGEPDPQA